MHSFIPFHDSFYSPAAELDNCNRDHVAHKALNITTYPLQKIFTNPVPVDQESLKVFKKEHDPLRVKHY